MGTLRYCNAERKVFHFPLTIVSRGNGVVRGGPSLRRCPISNCRFLLSGLRKEVCSTTYRCIFAHSVCRQVNNFIGFPLT